MNRLLTLAAAMLVAATLVPATGIAKSTGVAKSESRLPCTQATALALYYGFLPANDLLRRGFSLPAVSDALARCQYRVFTDPDHLQDHFTFSEDDWILGGIAEWWEYPALGMTRAEAIADLETWGDRVWLAKVRPDGTLGPAIEQPLMQTSYADWNTLLYGVVVWHHKAFIRKLPPGDYVSTHVQTYPGEPDFWSTIYLHILPRS